MNNLINSIPKHYIFDNPYQKLTDLVMNNNYSKVFLLVDDMTEKYCSPIFLHNTSAINIADIISIKSGEQSKSIENSNFLWEKLAEKGADRQSLLINLGGGMITDLGGFVASTYKRGIDFVNIPTTLLAMVDASIGNKTGVNLNHLKNQIGTLSPARLVIYDFDFLQTLSKKELRSGFAEVIKHGLIANKAYWNKLLTFVDILDDQEEMIKVSVAIKSKIVELDPAEQNIRKHLNFGHTLGHAIESFFYDNTDQKILHGEAIAHGMLLEAYLSYKTIGFKEKELLNLKEMIFKYFEIRAFTDADQKEVIDLLKHDKKNHNGQVQFVFLSEIGKAKEGQVVDESLIKDAFHFMNKS
jgi:3-dehydroquinate synthase